MNLENAAIALCANTPEGGYHSAHQLLSHRRPTALFVSNAQMMAGVMRAIKELHLNIPKDISVLSFDDTQWASFVDPPLTVVAQQPYELGRTAARLILESIEGNPQPSSQESKTVRLSTQLIERQSCRALH
jgi:LacI family transcriptional regulator